MEIVKQYIQEKQNNPTPKKLMKNTPHNGNCGANTYREKNNPAPKLQSDSI
jgi:hypothetical protein